jgi:hypothetical protein
MTPSTHLHLPHPLSLTLAPNTKQPCTFFSSTFFYTGLNMDKSISVTAIRNRHIAEIELEELLTLITTCAHIYQAHIMTNSQAVERAPIHELTLRLLFDIPPQTTTLFFSQVSTEQAWNRDNGVWTPYAYSLFSARLSDMALQLDGESVDASRLSFNPKRLPIEKYTICHFLGFVIPKEIIEMASQRHSFSLRQRGLVTTTPPFYCLIQNRDTWVVTRRIEPPPARRKGTISYVDAFDDPFARVYEVGDRALAANSSISYTSSKK